MTATDVLAFSDLLDKVKKHPNFLALLQMAYHKSWLTDEDFATILNRKEMDEVKKLYFRNPEASKLPIYSLKMPDRVGSIVIDAKEMPNDILKVSSSAISVLVHASVYYTLKDRHPQARVFLSQKNPTELPLIFSETTAVAMLSPCE